VMTGYGDVPTSVRAFKRGAIDFLAKKEIASTLKISVRTVEGHRRVVLRKMGVSSVAHLARAVARLERT